jgi:dipeptidyl aminopeptidase/acylaminoacyl peptidase
MIEVWCAKAWNYLAPSRRKLADKNKRLPSKRTGIALSVAVPTLVFLWYLAILADRPSHFDKIISKLGSATIGRFATTMSDHAGTRLVFMQGTEKGYGIFWDKIGSGKRKLIDEDPYTQLGAPHQTLLGWSPDDRFFAFSRYNGHWEIVVCDGDTGTTLATVPVNDRVSFGAWLSPQTLAFATRVRALFTIRHFQDKWSNPVPFKYFKKRSHKLPIEPMQNVTAFDTHSVVWKQGNIIWRCGEDSGAPVKVWESKTNRLIQFSFSQAANKFLLNYENAEGQFLADFYPDRTDELADITKINTKEYHVGYLNLINNGKGYVFMSQIGTTNMMVTRLDDSHASVQFQWPDQFSRFVPGQHEIFVASSLSNGPTGIWKYDVATGSTECVVPRAEENSYYLTNATVNWGRITNASGEMLTYYLYAPPRQSSVKKHPLIIGIGGIAPVGFAWNPNYQAFAECGYYFMYVERYQRNYSQWGEDVLTVYESLVKRLDIDKNRVYLYGVSAGSGAVSELLAEKPKLWRGVILLSPGAMPDPSQISGDRIFIDGGGDDPGFRKRAIQFQNEAVKAGIQVRLLIYPGLDHMLDRMPWAEQEQLRENLIFLNTH